MRELKKSNMKLILAAIISMALAFSFVAIVPTKAQVPMVELRAGSTFAGMGDITLDDGITLVPLGCLIEVRDTVNMNLVLTHFYMGDGTEGPPGTFRPGQFDVWVNVPLGSSITLRAYNAPTVGGSSLWGDSQSMIIPLSGTYDFLGWSLGNTQATSSSANATASGSITLTTFGLPIINSYDLRNSTNNLSVLNMRGPLDVGDEYYFVVNATDLSGTENISMVTIRAWYDGGLVENPDGYGTGVPNTEFAFQYNWFNQSLTLISTYTNADPEVRNVWGPTPTQSNLGNGTDPGPDTFELRIYFTLGEQIRHAGGDGVFNNPPSGEFNGTSTAAFNDLNSWNFDITVGDNNGFSAKAYDEFGVYQYTRISAGDISAEGLPGQVVAFPTLLINYSSNDDYSVGVYVNNTLTKIWPTTTPASTIPETNIFVAGGWLVKTPFTGTGYANTQWFYYARVAPDWGTYTTVPVQFWVNIPLNVLGGMYRGDVVYIIEQL